MNTPQKSAISPLVIARTQASVSQITDPDLAEIFREQPRLPEILWRIQKASMEPGGTEKHALGLIADFTPQFGPAIVHDDAAPLTPEERHQIWDKISGQVEQEMIPFKSWSMREDGDYFFSADMLASIGRYPSPRNQTERELFRSALLEIPREKFKDAFLDAAKDDLANHLRSMCEGNKDALSTPPWYCEKLMSILAEEMELVASRAELQLARTEVVSLVFDRLDYAWQEKVPVSIFGDSRVGKTFAISAWTAMNPGKVRLISTPSSNGERDLLMAVAESLGLEFTHNTSTRELRDQIKYILRHSGLMLIWDEFHFALPARYCRNTAPARLDFIRTEVVDRNLPTAFVSTPQAFNNGVSKFQKHTNFNFSQWIGRIMLNVNLPETLTAEDLYAVCAILGSGIPIEHHKLIVGRAESSAGYLKTIQAICCRARFIAKREKHAGVSRDDVALAASEVAPGQETRPGDSFSKPVRAVTPARQTPARQIAPDDEQLLSTRSTQRSALHETVNH